MKIFSENSLKQRQERITPILKSVLSNSEGVLIFAGEPIQKPGGHDQTYTYLPHPLYFWLSGSRRPGGVLAYTHSSGWNHFQVPISDKERIWEGVHDEVTGLDRSGLQYWITKHGLTSTYLMGQPANTDLKFGISPEQKQNFEIFTKIEIERRKKDTEEIQLIERAAQIAAIGYKKFQSCLRDGISERLLQVEYEAEVQKNGSHKLPYDTIIGTGSNSAILHAIPTERKLKNGEIVLIDAGVDLYDYCVDITRVFPVDGKFTTQTKALYDIVKLSHANGIKSAVNGSQWHETHKSTALTIAEGLKSLGVLKCSPEAALDSGAIALFYPHGVGHLVGLRVRDTGSPENPNPKMYYGAFLRADIKLEENILMTVEPGCYFIPALLNDSNNRKKYSDLVHFSECEKWLSIGGVRLEDDVLIQKSGPAKNLTAVVEKI